MVGQAELCFDDVIALGIDPQLAGRGLGTVDLEVEAQGLMTEVLFLRSEASAERAEVLKQRFAPARPDHRKSKAERLRRPLLLQVGIEVGEIEIVEQERLAAQPVAFR